MNSFSIKYQTAEIETPPFSHAIEINGKIVLNEAGGEPQLTISFELTYLDRNALTIEEIEGEGFTENDNFAWEGSLPIIWNDIILNTLKASKPLKINELAENQDFWEITDNDFIFYPKKAEEWKYLLEEIQQAVYEKAGKEAPMKLTFLKIENNNKTQTEIYASFAERELKTIKANAKIEYLAWEKLNPMLGIIFTAEFLPENALTKPPQNNGLFINTGDEFWYEVGKSVKYKANNLKQLTTIIA